MRRHTRWTIILAAAGICSTVGVAGLARADEPQPVAGCPASFNLSTVGDAIGQVDRRIYDDNTWQEIVVLVEGLDANQDGLLCWRHWGTSSGRDKHWGAEDYVVTQLGDNTRSGRLDKSVVV